MKGYVYAGRDETGPLVDAAPGRTIRLPDRGPPWLVLCHTAARVLPVNWPGRLWRAELIEPVSEEEMQAQGGAPYPGAGYTRAVAVEILDEAPLAILFGSHGEGLMQVIGTAEWLDAATAGILAAARAEGAAEAYGRAWERWLSQTRPELNAADRQFQDTLLWYGSPINGGFTLIHRLVSDRARLLDGDAAFETDVEEGETWVIAPWSDASAALCEAAMALGAPEMVPENDRDTLLRAYRSVCGQN